MTIQWGMLAPENVKTSRRRLTLGLGKAVMLYNEAAVPGLGGLWFIRQAALALLGIRIAEETRHEGSKIEVANAIEVSYSPILGQSSGIFKLPPAPADRFQCC